VANAIREIAQVAGEYQGYALSARRKFIELRLRQDPEIRALYLRGARSIGRRLKSREFATPGAKLYQRHLEEMEKVLRLEADVLKAGLTKRIDRYISAGADAGGTFSRAVTIDLFNKAGLSKTLPVAPLFAQANRQAIEACYARTHKGLYLSDRIWKAGENYRGTMQRIIQEAVATNQDPVATARMLEKYVAGGAKTLARDYPEMMKRMQGRIPSDVSYEALRLARTEMTAAYGEGVVASALVDPSATAIKWVLSASHPLEDICDTLAKQDLYRLGPGVYPVEAVPLYPAHPNELCHLQTVHADSREYLEKLKRWKADPSSQPDIEAWYQDKYSKFGKASKKAEAIKSEPGAKKTRSTTKASTKGQALSAEQEIERILKGVSLDDRNALARHLLDESGLTDCKVEIKEIPFRGYCATDKRDNARIVTELILQQDDTRPYRYQIKTVFHEVTHARMHGLISDERWTGDPKWLDIEETVAETVAHFMAKKAGVTGEIAPSYSDRLVLNLPRLKRLHGFENCSSIADFGEVLAKYRYEMPTAQWAQISDLLTKNLFDVVEYSKQYEAYVKKHLDEIVALIYENTGADNNVTKDLIRGSVVQGWKEYNLDYPGFADSLIIAMNRKGVR